jgi:oligopeptide/dipeptide ABC transporter ATP-binding protein
MTTMSREQPILSIRDLSIIIEDDSGVRTAVEKLSLDIERGQTLALVGESGAGKSLTALATLGILPTPPARVSSGAILFEEQNLLALPERAMRKLRGDRISMIFQEPITSLNPLMPVGEQIGEAMLIHQGLGKKNTREQVLALMEMTGIPDPRRRYRSYPHQLSGGIRQRVMIAMALSCRPKLLLADEPTSALDTTVQAQIVDLLSRLIRDLGMSVLLITHDLGVVAAMADRVIVVHDGRAVEEGAAREILKDPLHPYTRGLLAARPFSRDSVIASRITGSAIENIVEDSKKRGCRFASLCPIKTASCENEAPSLCTVAPGRKVRCIAPEQRNG